MTLPSNIAIEDRACGLVIESIFEITIILRYYSSDLFWVTINQYKVTRVLEGFTRAKSSPNSLGR